MVLHDPQTLAIFGPFNIVAPILSFCIAFAHVAIYTYSRNTKAFAYLSGFYIFAAAVSRFPAATSPTEWGPATDLVDFAIFGSMPFVGIFGLYFLYNQDPKVKDLMHNWPAHFICAHQLYRLGGGIFLYMYMQQGMTSYFNLQTGIADMFMGSSAIPMALYVRNKPLKDVKSTLMVWHCIGLYDLFSAFAFAIGDFFGLVHYVPCPAYIAFFPVTLICYFQVAWAMGIHMMYLTSYDEIAEAQDKKHKNS